MAEFHETMTESRMEKVEEEVRAAIVVLSEALDMSIPSAVWAFNSITTRALAHWDKAAEVKNLRMSARYISGDLPFAKFDQGQRLLFDRFVAGYERDIGEVEN